MARHSADDPRRRDRQRGIDGPRAAGRSDALRSQRDRAQIAQAAARLIVEHGITDWSLAKRKAARTLLLPDSTPLPSNDAIEQALADHHALFGGDAHRQSLLRQRKEALTWMRRLEPFVPLLVGGVAAGWATEHSDVRLELIADDPKVVEMALAGAGVAYAAAPPNDDANPASGSTDLRIATPRSGVRIAILTPAQRRNRPRRDDEPRLTADAVAALLASGPG